MGNVDKPFLVIPDTQIPYEDEGALKFLHYIKKHYKVPDENCYHVGDELDQYWGGMWAKSPEADMTALEEIAESKKRLKEWYKVFPQLKLCTSNHGSRWMRKALNAEIPSQMLRSYEEMIESPPGWKWKKFWKVETKRPFIIEHGDDWGGNRAHINAALHNGCSTVIGHHHSLCGTLHMKTNGLRIWAFAVGALIDFEQYAFDYARKAKLKPVSGAGLIFQGGTTPIWIPKDS